MEWREIERWETYLLGHCYGHCWPAEDQEIGVGRADECGRIVLRIGAFRVYLLVSTARHLAEQLWPLIRQEEARIAREEYERGLKTVADALRATGDPVVAAAAGRLEGEAEE